MKKLNLCTICTIFSTKSLQANSFLGILLLLSLAFHLQLTAAATVQFCPEFSVCSEVKDYEYYKINSYFFQTTYLFSRMYNLEFPKYTLEVIIDDKVNSNVIRNEKTPSAIVVITNQKILFDDIQNFERSLIKAFLLAEISIHVDKYKDSDIEWIISGSLREINWQRASLMCPDFPIVSWILQRKGKLNYKKIITLDRVEEGILRDYFAEESQILLDAILKKKKGNEFLFEYIKNLQSQNKYNREKLFDKLLNKYQSDFGLTEKEISDSFNEYLNKTAAELAKNSRSLAGNEILGKYLHETERKKSNIGRKYYFYLLELEKQNDPIARAWPELQKFLDENYPIDIN